MKQRKIVVLGIGNLLLSDEGVGIEVIKELRKKYKLSEEVEIVDGGTGGFSLLPFIESANKLLVIDAISGDKSPGTIYKFKNEEIPLNIMEKISLHEVNFADILNLAQLRGSYPEEIVIIGIEPETLEMQATLSETVRRKIPLLLSEVINQLKELGVEVEELSY